MKVKVLDLSQKQEWNDYLAKLPIEQQDIYYTPEYYELYERNGDGKAQCFVFEKDGDIALYPFLLNSVNELGYDLDNEYYDIQGAYGYNGVVTSSYDNYFIKEFFEEFVQYCKKNNIITEFIRYNPIIENHKFYFYNKPIYTLDNVLIDLQPKIGMIWKKSFDNGVRKAIKKGIRNNLHFESYLGKDLSKDLLEKFIKIYYSTMNRNMADTYYFFSLSYFNNVVKIIKENSLFSFVIYKDKIISVELNFFLKNYAYGFVGGTLANFYNFSPNSFLRLKVIRKLKDLGVKYYSIGGGQKKNDSKYKFKKSFSRYVENKFYIGKKIHDHKTYEKLINQWKNNYPASYAEHKQKILGYRFIK